MKSYIGTQNIEGDNKTRFKNFTVILASMMLPLKQVVINCLLTITLHFERMNYYEMFT